MLGSKILILICIVLFLLYYTFTEALSYIIFLINTFFYLKLKIKLKIGQKTYNFKNLKEIFEIWRNFQKLLGYTDRYVCF